jgi:hypothetical protein
MKVDERRTGQVLSQDRCNDRLARGRRGFLAFTERALPMVAPAEVQVRGGQLLVTVYDAGLRERLVGQVVAVGIGRRALPCRRGWQVVARGQLRTTDQGDALALEPCHLDGNSYRRFRRTADRTDRQET